MLYPFISHADHWRQSLLKDRLVRSNWTKCGMDGTKAEDIPRIVFKIASCFLVSSSWKCFRGYYQPSGIVVVPIAKEFHGVRGF
jgi:hypothetical protein